MTRRCRIGYALCCGALLCATFMGCGRDVDIGRYVHDAGHDADNTPDSGGTGGVSGSSGDGGSGGHDECEEFEPVCGSDDVTYMNRCLALRAGITSVTRGACR